MEIDTKNGIAIIKSDEVIIKNVQSALNLMDDVRFQVDCDCIAIHKTEVIKEIMKRALLEEIKSLVRTETPADHVAVYELIKAAFAKMEHADGNEQDLVERMRKSVAFVPELSLVAEIEGKLIGHIMFTKISIGDHIGLCLAPVSVLPEYQKYGVGSALIKRGHEIAVQLVYELCLLVGHAEYYPRFGYERASKYAITQPFPAPDECVMVKFLTDAGREITGAAVFPPEFY